MTEPTNPNPSPTPAPSAGPSPSPSPAPSAGPSPSPSPSPTPTPKSEPAPSPAPTAKSGSDELSLDQIEEMLSFDPFSTRSKTPEAEPQPAPDPGKQAAPEPTPAPTPAPATTPTPDSEALQRRVAELEEQLRRAQPPAQPPKDPKEPKDTTPPYEFTIPPALLQAIDSEDPAQKTQALGALMTGTARAVHKTIMQNFEQELGTLVQRLPQVIQQHVSMALEQREVFQDFYTTYKDLNNPDLRPLVVQVASRVMQETGAKSWTQQVRDEVARRVYGILGRPMSGAQPLTPVAPPAPPAYNPGGGVREPAGNPVTPQVNDIAATIF